MKLPVITISREYGSGGRAIGEKVAQALGIPFYDNDRISELAKESGLADVYIKKTERMKATSFLYGLYMNATQQPTRDDLFELQSKVIQKVADEGPCVIVGRCADYILRDRKDLFSVFIHAPMEFRVRRAKTAYDVDADNMEAHVKKQDKERANFYNHIQAEVAKVCPDARVGGYAYENYVEAPQKTKVDPRVIIDYVPRSYLPYDKTESEFFRKHWMGWKKAGAKDFIYRPNYTLACGGYHLDQGRLILADFAFAYTNGMDSCMFDSLRGSWAAHAVMGYALIRAMRDPLHGYDRACDEMLSAFGSARKEVARFFDAVRANTERLSFADIRKMSWANHTGAQGGGSHGNCEAILEEFFEDRFFPDGYAILDRAVKAAGGDRDVVARIEFLRKGLRNTELTRQVRIAQKRWLESGRAADKKPPFDAAFKAMCEYRASVEDDCVCNFADCANSEINSMAWPHKAIAE